MDGFFEVRNLQTSRKKNIIFRCYCWWQPEFPARTDQLRRLVVSPMNDKVCILVSWRISSFPSAQDICSFGRLPRGLRSKELILLHDISLEAYANIDPQKMAILWWKGVTFSKAYHFGYPLSILVFRGCNPQGLRLLCTISRLSCSRNINGIRTSYTSNLTFFRQKINTHHECTWMSQEVSKCLVSGLYNPNIPHL